MVQLTYYPPRDVQDTRPETPVTDARDGLPWGYSLRDLDQLARMAVRRVVSRYGDYHARYEAAWSGVVDALVDADEQPDRADLIYAGWRSVNAWAKTEAYQHGVLTATWTPSARFAAYWTSAAGSSPERLVVERRALDQIWPTLTVRQREALTWLALSDDYDQAAAAMGVSYGTFQVTISQARRRFFTLWHEGETPSKPWRPTCRRSSRGGTWRGRRRITASQLEAARERHLAGETITALAAEHGVWDTTLGALLRGVKRPATDAAPEGIDLNNAWAASADTASTPEEVPDGA